MSLEEKPKSQKKKAAKKAAPTKTPEEHAHSLGLCKMKKCALQGGRLMPLYHWTHAAASALHGWKQHEHDANEPMKMTEEDYKAALEAVQTKPPYQPHKGALSPHRKG